MSELHQDIIKELGILQFELESAGLWADLAPSDEAFLSTQPFCCDLMSFSEWLQWIFIPSLMYLAETQKALPQKSAILPMAEEAFTDLEGSLRGLFASLARIDALLTA